jgi:rRNA-processing protein FCF1
VVDEQGIRGVLKSSGAFITSDIELTVKMASEHVKVGYFKRPADAIEKLKV